MIPGDLEFMEEYEDRKNKNQFVGSLGLQKQGSLLRDACGFSSLAWVMCKGVHWI